MCICGDQHRANECTTVTSHSARKDIVRQKHLCYTCLGNHLVSSCRSSNRCRNCHKKHHSSICDRQSIPQGQTTLNLAAADFLPVSSSHTDMSTSVKRSNPVSSHGGQSAILHSTTQERQNVFLKTAIARFHHQTAAVLPIFCLTKVPNVHSSRRAWLTEFS